MDERKLRESAVRGYRNGGSPKRIYQTLGRSKRWFYKWLKRSQKEGEDWAKGLSRKPHRMPKKTDESMEQAVVETRKSLVGNPYAQIGAFTISWNMTQQGIKPPSIATINRILKRNNLVAKRAKYQPKGISYPSIKVASSNHLHQFDSLGPRYLKDDGRFYSANIIDALDHRCCVNPKRRQNYMCLGSALMRSWQVLGIPTFLQMDNMLPMRGSNRHPHSFGLVVRLCLHLGIQPVFIPIHEPWRNGIVEHFQNVFDKSFFRSQKFDSFTHLVQKAQEFEIFHNHHHRYSPLGGKTPAESVTGNLRYLPNDFKLPTRMSITPGLIHLVRFIRSNRILDIFGERYRMPLDVVYEYVWATIDTANGTLSIYHDNTLVHSFDYHIPKTAYDLSEFTMS